MNFNNFTIKSQEAVQEAVNLVKARGQQAIEPAHLLAGVMKVGENVTNFIFQKLGVNGQQIALVVDKQIDSLPKVSGGEPYLSRESNDVLQKATQYSKEMGDEFVSLEHLLLALLTVKSTVATILKDAGMTEKELRSAINELRKEGVPLLEAIHEAGRRRLRPIIMTSLTTIFAMVPLLFSFDLGSELQKPLSIAMIGTMTIGTLVSLFIIPLLYWFIYRNKEKR